MSKQMLLVMLLVLLEDAMFYGQRGGESAAEEIVEIEVETAPKLQRI